MTVSGSPMPIARIHPEPDAFVLRACFFALFILGTEGSADKVISVADEIWRDGGR